MPGVILSNGLNTASSHSTVVMTCQVDPVDPACWTFRSDKAHAEFLVIVLLIALMVAYWIYVKRGIVLKRDRQFWE